MNKTDKSNKVHSTDIKQQQYRFTVQQRDD